MANYYLLENGTDRLLMEDGSLFLNENSPSFVERDGTLTATIDLAGARAVITLRDSALAGSIAVSGAGVTVLARAGTITASADIAGAGAEVQAQAGTLTGQSDIQAAQAVILGQSASLTSTAAVSAAGATIELRDAATTATAELVGESAELLVISSDAAISAGVELAADGEDIGGAGATIIESDAVLVAECTILADGENIGIAVASGGAAGKRPGRYIRGVGQVTHATVVESDAQMACAISTVFVGESVLPAPAPLEALKPIVVEAKTPPALVKAKTKRQGKKRRVVLAVVQDAPELLVPSPVEYIDFEDEIALCLLVA